MTFKELFRQDAFKTVFTEIEKFSSEKLKDYNDKLEKRTLSNSSKEIFDAVWGNVEFFGGEIYILDSPLLQRLRKIKQLGLAYFVYCGSDYSRFYHTVGVTFLAERMSAAINKCKLGTDEAQKNYFKEVVRLAAIFHDVGHMFLSHVSEHYFGKSPLYPRNEVVSGMLEEFEKKAAKRIALHEMLSCMIVNTKEVRRLLKKVSGLFMYIDLKNDAKALERLIEYISCLIVGVPVDREILPYSSIINGPIDADKCDYLSRDSHVTRVPVAVDISRITQKLSVVKTEDIHMSDLWHTDAKQMDSYELAMKDSAEKSLFQLCIARTIMYDSVYYHHKVLTAETVFRNILNELSRLEKPIFNTFDEILHYSDEDFNAYFLEGLKKGREESDIILIERISLQLKKLYDRELAKRIACFMPDYLIGRQRDVEALFDSILTTIDSEEEQSLLFEVKSEYRKIKNLLGEECKEPEDINIFVIQAPPTVYGHSKIQVPIDMHNGKPRDFKGYELVNSRETSSSSSYIVTGEEDRIAVYLALEKLLHKKFNIYMSPEGISCGKFDPQDIAAKSLNLFNKGYFDDSPELLKDDLVVNYISEAKVKKIGNKFSSYEGPGGYKLEESDIKNFFKQILSASKDKQQCKLIIDGIIRLLENALFLNRKHFSLNAEKMVDILSGIKSADGVVYVVPLGSVLDSGKHMSYYLNDIIGKEVTVEIDAEKTLVELLKKPAVNTVTFFDDGLYSGTQLISIMQEYLGIPEESRKSQEHHVETLPEELFEAFKNKKIVCFFIVFNKNQEQKIREELNKLGIKDIQFHFIEDMSDKWLEKAKSGYFKNEAQQITVKEFLESIGFDIMETNKKTDGKYKAGWNEERVKKAALGYKDAQQMVFLKSSVPTYTITAFWQKGRVNGWEWKPLFKRTEK